MSDFQERFQIRQDTIAGKIPKRVFVSPNVSLEAACIYAGVPLVKAHFDRSLVEQAYRKVTEDFYADSFACMDLRYVTSYQILGAKNWVLGSNGAVQHPEIETMKVSDYDDFIKDPYASIVKTMLPRVCSAFDTGDATLNALNLAKGYAAYKKTFSEEIGIVMKLSAEYQKAPGMLAGGLVEAPFDFLADQLRGFKQISMDVRRCPDKVAAACEAVLPHMIKCATPSVIGPGAGCFIPLHLPPYMRMSDFEKLYWPTFEKLVVTLDKMGISSFIFAEQNWTRYSSFLETLPESTIVLFEDGDYAHLKATVGKNHVIGGFYDPTHTLSQTKEQAIDEVKRLIDTCAPGGKFFFSYGRGLMDFSCVNVPILQDVLEWVHVNAVY